MAVVGHLFKWLYRPLSFIQFDDVIFVMYGYDGSGSQRTPNEDGDWSAHSVPVIPKSRHILPLVAYEQDCA